MNPQTPSSVSPAQPSWDEIGRYLAGESSADERAAVQRWLDEHRSDAEVIAALDRATKGMIADRSVDVEAALRNVKTRAKAPSPNQFARFSNRFEAYAAAAAILLFAGLYLVRSVSHTGTVESKSYTYSTAIGKRDSVQLPDGTRIIIGPASKVVVEGRSVILQGEAFFSVKPNLQQPFTVRAGDAIIRDIGTEFSVHSDSAQSVRVIVREGIVMLSHQRDSVRLEARDVGLATTAGVQATRGSATSDDLAWTTGRLVFHNAPIGELVADLRRWYGVELKVSTNDSALLKRHFTGSFASETSSQVLDVIALALGARLDRQGDTATLRTTKAGK
jgi:transmembrane sensor